MPSTGLGIALIEGSLEMYTLQIRIYEGSDKTRYYGELYEGEPEADVVTMTAHMDLGGLSLVPAVAHVQIMDGCRLVCTEIAQNIEQTMF